MIAGAVLYLSKSSLTSNRYGKVATLFFYAATLSIVFRLPDLVSMALFFLTVILNILAFFNYLQIYLEMRKNLSA